MRPVIRIDRSMPALAVFLLAGVGAASADDERYAMGQVRLTTEPAHAQGCTRIGSMRHDSVKDLRRKIVRAGGNAAVISFRPEDVSAIYADVYRCGGGAPAAVGPAPAPRTPPTPGAPPPPPPPPPPPLR
jgi:hypothetical protein